MVVQVQSHDNGVVAVTLQRPEARNALSWDLLRGVNQGLGELLRQGGVTGVTVSGAGGYFSAGADLKEMAEAREAGEDGRRRLQMAMAEFIYLMTNLHTLPVPTVALVEGGASGGGMGLLASCQWVVAQRDAKLRLPEASIGLFPFMISPVLIRRIGIENFVELTFGGQSLSAEEGREMGLVDEVVDELPGVEELAGRPARPKAVWPEEDVGEVEGVLARYPEVEASLVQAARTAALMTSSMALPVAMRTGAIELRNLVAQGGGRR